MRACGMPGTDWCRHCSIVDVLTREHLPPRSARNRGRVQERRLSFDHRPEAEIGEWMEGHTRTVLCETCQHNPPEWRYPEEYNKWREAVIPQLEARVRQGNAATGQGALVNVKLPYDRMPGRFSRMVLGMILSALDDPSVVREHSMLTAAIGAGLPRGSKPPNGASIEPWRLLLALADEPWGYTTRLVLAPGGGAVASFVDPPFVYYLHHGSDRPHSTDATDITHWLAWDHAMRLDGPRKSEASLLIPFRFRAYDFAEYHYMLLLGALYAVETDKIPVGAEPHLVRLQKMRLVAKDGDGWILTALGSNELATACVLADRWQLPESR
jgi:hypothetical protein